MPQGVEHRNFPTCGAYEKKVQESLMPQGVEHMEATRTLRLDPRAGIIDAARR